jgi:hypothetical protein
MSGKTVTAWLLGMLVVAALLAPGASAAKPTFNVIEIDESFADDFLSDACGVAVTTHIQGRIIQRAMDDTGTGLAVVSTVNVAVTATAGDNTIRFRDVGADLVRIEPDGTAILMIIGQLPFDFTGVLKIDLETGEAILEPHHFTGDELEQACAVLTA